METLVVLVVAGLFLSFFVGMSLGCRVVDWDRERLKAENAGLRQTIDRQDCEIEQLNWQRNNRLE